MAPLATRPCSHDAAARPARRTTAASVRGVRAFAHDVFTYPLPERHRFPLAKYRLVRQGAESLAGVAVETSAPASWDEVARVHTPTWIAKVREGRLERREELALGLPWSPELVERSVRATGATIQAARAALEDGAAANLGGGTHHAFSDSGRGFCVLNDVVVALRALRAEGRVRRVLVVDLDVHQGDGTHALLATDPDAFTLSLNGFRNYPFQRVAGDLEHDFPDGTGDDAYLAILGELLPQALRRARPELAFVLAGADPYERDRLGRLALTQEGLAARDALVRDTLRGAGVPVCVTLAGGYAEDVRDTVAINLRTVATFSALRS
jgi:acetoin utilization deacetylase AcuC-like enzyme